MHFGIIRERKTPPDHRVVLSPKACQIVLETYPEAQITVESSPIRVFSDQEYRDAGITVADSVAECDVLLGVKEVPIEDLIPNKKYFFFSHTIKEQPYNRKLLQAILEKNIELYDHEVITNKKGIRLVAFGRYAGIVGAYNGIRAYGIKSGAYTLPKAHTLKEKADLIDHLKNIDMPPIKIILTGKGRVGNGAREMLEGMGLKEVEVEAYLNESFDEAVYCQIDVLEYNKRADGAAGDMYEFFNHPELYISDFFRFAKVTDLYIAGHFYGQGAPNLITEEEAAHPDFNINTIADISCDIKVPIASTIRASSIEDPIYGYHPQSKAEVAYDDPEAIAVMAVDNLPAELPRDASRGFGFTFVETVIPSFFDGDAKGILDRARMTKDGQLTERYRYLEDYVRGI